MRDIGPCGIVMVSRVKNGTMEKWAFVEIACSGSVSETGVHVCCGFSEQGPSLCRVTIGFSKDSDSSVLDISIFPSGISGWRRDGRTATTIGLRWV